MIKNLIDVGFFNDLFDAISVVACLGVVGLTILAVFG